MISTMVYTDTVLRMTTNTTWNMPTEQFTFDTCVSYQYNMCVSYRPSTHYSGNLLSDLLVLSQTFLLPCQQMVL